MRKVKRMKATLAWTVVDASGRIINGVIGKAYISRRTALAICRAKREHHHKEFRVARVRITEVRP